MDNNLSRYNAPDVVEFYTSQDQLQEVEKVLFDRYLTPGVDILDMGVGGGRTTPFLAQIAGRYVGADYSTAMVKACQDRFSNLEFVAADARAMPMFADNEFETIVFSFNGIDTIGDDADRKRCLEEFHRVLKPNGFFIFSSHNARVLGVWPLLRTARGKQIPWRIARSVFKSIKLTVRGLTSKSYYAGQGYIRDPVHGGMDHYTSTPKTMRPQLEAAGFEVLEVMSGHYPDTSAMALTPWHYYACRKIHT